jgi:hypothetical protein
MSRGGAGNPSPRAVKPGDVFGVEFLNPPSSKKAFRVEGGPPLLFNATAASTDANGLVDPDGPVAFAWEFVSAVLPKQKTMKEQAQGVDAAAAKAARRAKVEGKVRELERPAYELQSAVSAALADNPCWREGLALQPGERLVCALCFSRLSGPLQEGVSFAPRALRDGEAARRVVAEAVGKAAAAAAAGGAKGATSSAGKATGGAMVAAALAGAFLIAA